MARKGDIRHIGRKGRTKTISICRWFNCCAENPKESTKNLELISDFSKITGHKQINKENNIYVSILAINMWTVYFIELKYNTIYSHSGKRKYLEVNLTKLLWLVHWKIHNANERNQWRYE